VGVHCTVCVLYVCMSRWVYTLYSVCSMYVCLGGCTVQCACYMCIQEDRARRREADFLPMLTPRTNYSVSTQSQGRRSIRSANENTRLSRPRQGGQSARAVRRTQSANVNRVTLSNANRVTLSNANRVTLSIANRVTLSNANRVTLSSVNRATLVIIIVIIRNLFISAIRFQVFDAG